MKHFDLLPEVRGKYRFNAPLSALVWFQVGGPADVLFRPEDRADLQSFLKHYPITDPLTILGVGSNVLIRDGGIPGVVVKLGKGFSQISIEGNKIRAGAGALDRTVALLAAEHGMTGLSFLAGIPGTIGGALKMNAGAYGTEIQDVLESCLVMNRQGDIVRKTPEQLQFSYRSSHIKDDEIVIEATFLTRPSTIDACKDEVKQVLIAREASQPTKGRTGGSTFKNPEGLSAWKLIDAAGCRGLKFGGAQVSEKHTNFIINTGNASAYDIEMLMAEVRRAVFNKEKVLLDLEIKRLGMMENRPKIQSTSDVF